MNFSCWLLLIDQADLGEAGVDEGFDLGDELLDVGAAGDRFLDVGLGDELGGADDVAQFVTEADVEESIPCGADVEEFVAKIKPFIDAGFTEVGLVQIGGDQQEKFIAWAERELLPALREL